MTRWWPRNWVSNLALTPNSFNHYLLIWSTVYLPCVTGKFVIETSLHSVFTHYLLVVAPGRQGVGNSLTRRQYLCCIRDEVSLPGSVVEEVDAGRQYQYVWKYKKESRSVVCLEYRVPGTKCRRWGSRNLEGCFITGLGCHAKEFGVLSEGWEGSWGTMTRRQLDRVCLRKITLVVVQRMSIRGLA